jgi:hypothetical protein
MPDYGMPTGPLTGLRYALPLSIAFWSVVVFVILTMA